MPPVLFDAGEAVVAQELLDFTSLPFPGDACPAAGWAIHLV